MVELESKDRPAIRADVLNPKEHGWNDEVDDLRRKLGAPENPYLFPPHFIKKTLRSIGGEVIEFKDKNQLIGVGFMFPRVDENGRGYTLRFHSTSEKIELDKIQSLAEQALYTKHGKRLPVFLYVPEEAGKQDEVQSVFQNGLAIERTSLNTAPAIRNLQKKIWGVLDDDFLYPEDIHSNGFSLPTSLIALLDSNPVGFLFGFDKFSDKEIPSALRGYITNSTTRLESQLMGVLPDQRSRNIGTKLKMTQSEEAARKGIEIINWTFDPLLSQNAMLNINKLGGLVWEHNANYYAFSGVNMLNQVQASRFSVSWLINSPRVKNATQIGIEPDRNLRVLEELRSGAIPIINSASECDSIQGQETRSISSNFLHSIESPSIAIEIPTNWIAIQSNNIGLAQEWRGITDSIFQEYIGASEENYVITSVAVVKAVNGEISRSFLIANPTTQLERVFLGRI